MPIAQPRRSGGKAVLSTASAIGMIVAAPTPCTARAAINASAVGDSAHAADAAANNASPAANTRRRPNRSPSADAVNSSTAKLRVYALTVHSSCSIEAPRSRRIVLRAVETTSRSRTTMNEAVAASPRTQV